MPTNYAKAQLTPIKIAILLFDQTKLIDVTGPVQVFNDARLPAGQPAYAVSLVSRLGGPVMTDTGVALATISFEACTLLGPDTVLVSGGDSALDKANSTGIPEFLLEMFGACRRLGSICLGAFILARAGLLDGRRATTHWENCADLGAAYPKIKVEKDAIYTEDNGVWTSAGVTTGIDMALAMVKEDFGRAEALRLAKSLVLYVRRLGGQSQFSSSLKAQMQGRDDRFDQLVGAIVGDLSSDWPVSRMAATANMSQRNFSRVFTKEMRASPGRFVEQVRVDAVCEALQAGERDLAALGQRCGFENMERMRRAFHRIRGVSPSDYRARFGKR